ncbi:pyridoxal-phosphate dependent enzyme [Ferruginibacter lapsinanis]|uniref:1-aminocyclopropane-1-carboxylate deaminase/D-cysteine desulfhydrase n=1 Tax=Ferruginibacter lapsinanis TaxID=563172 RepID=UPI001E4D47B8|nr:pyridoxal-phosphate dependent enzyme [Ferruginibacter lapsinanis]UEG49134.1 pyridoxal-phosphate dependent enzyme [Ferruginibacter lapsinanis]
MAAKIRQSANYLQIMLLNSENIILERLENDLFVRKQIKLSVLRLDKIHPVISGNKLFKLHYFLQEANNSTHKTIITFGGPYSNHLSATAYACKLSGLKSIGIVRGEKPQQLSHTLQQCIADGMHLHFISRELYAQKKALSFAQRLTMQFGEHILIPEGGYHPLGAKGASMIIQFLANSNATHICSAIGTATTIAGLLLGCKANQQIIGVSVLKGMTNIQEDISAIINTTSDLKQLTILNDYHFGGYAKKTPELISFMNDLYDQYQLPTDFVYTGKLMYGIIDSIKKDIFKPGSDIVCVHTGGLQGNVSLPSGTLIF